VLWVHPAKLAAPDALVQPPDDVRMHRHEIHYQPVTPGASRRHQAGER